ncbi:MAG: SDR family NAD(P)-dependent oxidoreductase [Chloroflexia bacterium]|nr:SDR family NAD(P)-dependent oxidoreductase [Chloroflexia bacterium]
MDINKHTFLIAGGGSGLGAAAAYELVGAGGRVIIADINAAAGEATAAALGEQAHFVATDVTSEAEVKRALAAATTHTGRLDGVINCAGIAGGARVLGKDGPMSLEHFSRVVNINLVGTFNVLRLAAEVMAQNEPGESGERGVIINTSSIAAFDGQIGQAAYAATKGGIVAMALPIARELARFGIRVMTIAPGTFDTPLLAGLPEETRTSLAQQIPFPARLGRPDEYARLARHIIENQMLNGEVIRLDGAIRMQAR